MDFSGWGRSCSPVCWKSWPPSKRQLDILNIRGERFAGNVWPRVCSFFVVQRFSPRESAAGHVVRRRSVGMTVVKLDMRHITDWDTFHAVFAKAFGFPDFYGRNMNAWIDCMTDLDDLEGRMTSVHVEPGQIVTLQ